MRWSPRRSSRFYHQYWGAWITQGLLYRELFAWDRQSVLSKHGYESVPWNHPVTVPQQSDKIALMFNNKALAPVSFPTFSPQELGMLPIQLMAEQITGVHQSLCIVQWEHVSELKASCRNTSTSYNWGQISVTAVPHVQKPFHIEYCLTKDGERTLLENGQFEVMDSNMVKKSKPAWENKATL